MIFTFKLLMFIEALQIASFVIFRASLKREAQQVIGPIDLALMLAIPVVGLFGRDKNVFYALLFLIPLLSIGKPRQLAGRYLLILPLFPEVLQSYVVGGVYIADVSAIDAFNLGALTALVLTSRGRARPVHSIDAAIWLFFLVSLVMEVRGVPLPGVLRSTFFMMLAVVPPSYIMARLVSTRSIARDATLFLALGGMCNAVIAVFESLRRWPLYQAIQDDLGVPFAMSATLSIRAGLLRAQGAVANPTVLGLVLALALIAMLAARPRFRPLGWALVMALLAGGLLLCQSRGAWIAAVAGVALYLLYERRTAILAAFVSVSALLLVAILAFFSGNSRIGGLIGRSGHAEGTAEYRRSLLARGLEEIAAHPLLGQTRTQLDLSMNDMRQSEHIIDFVNTHLHVALASGLPGLALWLIAWLMPLAIGWQLRGRRAAHDAQSPVALPFAMIAACFVCLAFTSTIDRMVPLVMLSVGMMSAYARLAKTGEATSGARGPAARRPRLIAAVAATSST